MNEDYLTVAATIGVNRSTARSIVARYLREGRIAERPRGGANHVRVDDEMRNCLNDILNENYLLTLAQINQELRQRLPRKPTIHDRKVAKERLSQARLNLDLNDHVIFIYDGTPAHNHPVIPGPNSELKKLPPYSPFLNIVEQAISALKAVLKVDIRRP